MKILGTVLHISSHRNLIVRGDETDNKRGPPAINARVFDNKKKTVGKISDVFGPVTSPFYSVKLFKNVTNEHLRGFRHTHVYVN